MADRQMILVTGSNGQLGMELKDLAGSFPQFEFLFTSRNDLPIDDFTAVRSFFETHRPSACINCAAYTKVDAAETHKEEAWQINAEAVSVLAEFCQRHDAQFIHISTDYVFNGQATEPYLETAATDPVNSYGASKLAGENYALRANPESIIIRTSWVYSSYGNNFVKTMLRLMDEKPEINVVNDQLGSPTYAADLAEAILQILSCPNSTSNGGIYHFSNDGVISWYDFAVAIKELTGSQCKVNPIPTSAYPTPAKRPAFSGFDKTKIQSHFGIRLKNWKESLTACIQKIKKQN